MSWHKGPLASFDCETTGLNVERDRIVTAALVQVGGGQQAATTEWLSDPGMPIPEAASRVHGITTERARQYGSPAVVVVAQIAAAIVAQARAGVPLVVMNAPYDLTLLDRELQRHGLPSLQQQLGSADLWVIDPRVIDKQADRWRKGRRTLQDLAAHYRVELTDAHSAAADALAAARVVLAIAEKFPNLQEWPLEQLHGMQQEWAAGQAYDYQQYQRRTDPNAVIAGDWPLIPRPRVGGAR